MDGCESCMALKRGTPMHREWKLWKSHSFSEEWLESRPANVQRFLRQMQESWNINKAVE